jgi:protein SCO1/2
MNRRSMLWALVGVVAVLLAAFAGWRFVASPHGGAANAGQAQIGGPFQMVDQAGRAADQRLLNGKWTAIFFGYTFCPDVCPTTLQTLAVAQDQLGDKARGFQVVFVSVDPARDKPPQLKAYLASGSFPHGVTGLTGSDAQVAQIAKAYKVFYEKQGAGANYTVDHSAVIYLMNPRGGFDSVMPYNLPPEQIKTHILQAMQAG